MVESSLLTGSYRPVYYRRKMSSPRLQTRGESIGAGLLAISSDGHSPVTRDSPSQRIRS